MKWTALFFFCIHGEKNTQLRVYIYIFVFIYCIIFPEPDRKFNSFAFPCLPSPLTRESNIHTGRRFPGKISATFNRMKAARAMRGVCARACVFGGPPARARLKIAPLNQPIKLLSCSRRGGKVHLWTRRTGPAMSSRGVNQSSRPPTQYTFPPPKSSPGGLWVV